MRATPLQGGALLLIPLLRLEGPFVTVGCDKGTSKQVCLTHKGCRYVEIMFLDGNFSLAHTEHRHHD